MDVHIPIGVLSYTYNELQAVSFQQCYKDFYSQTALYQQKTRNENFTFQLCIKAYTPKSSQMIALLI